MVSTASPFLLHLPLLLPLPLPLPVSEPAVAPSSSLPSHRPLSSPSSPLQLHCRHLLRSLHCSLCSHCLEHRLNLFPFLYLCRQILSLLRLLSLSRALLSRRLCLSTLYHPQQHFCLLPFPLRPSSLSPSLSPFVFLSPSSPPPPTPSPSSPCEVRLAFFAGPSILAPSIRCRPGPCTSSLCTTTCDASNPAPSKVRLPPVRSVCPLSSALLPSLPLSSPTPFPSRPYPPPPPTRTLS